LLFPFLLPLFSLFLSHFALKLKPLKSSYRVLGSAVSFPSGVGRRSRNQIACIFV